MSLSLRWLCSRRIARFQTRIQGRGLRCKNADPFHPNRLLRSRVGLGHSVWHFTMDQNLQWTPLIALRRLRLVRKLWSVYSEATALGGAEP